MIGTTCLRAPSHDSPGNGGISPNLHRPAGVCPLGDTQTQLRVEKEHNLNTPSHTKLSPLRDYKATAQDSQKMEAVSTLSTELSTPLVKQYASCSLVLT